MNSPTIPPRGDEPNLPARLPRSLVPAHGFVTEEEPEQRQDGLDITTILRILWEKRLLILAVTGLGFLIALTISLLQPPQYRSTATLELNPPTIPILNNGSRENQDLAVPVTDKEFLETQYGLLESKALAVDVIEDLELAPRASRAEIDDLSDELIGRLEIAPVRSSRLVEISYSDGDPKESARIVNGYANAFVTSTLERRFEAAASARTFLERRLAEVRVKLDESERKLVAYAQANGIITTGAGAGVGADTDSLQGASLMALNSALSAAQQRRIAAEQRYRNMTGAGSAAEVSQSTANLRDEKAKLEAEYREKSTYLKDDYPEMVRLRSRLESVDRAIAAETGNVSGSRESTLRAEFIAAQQEENQLQGRVNQLKGAVLNLRERSIQYNILERELDTNRSLYDALLERYNEIGVAGGINAPQASLVDPGGVPKSAYAPNIPYNAGLGALLGLALGIAMAFGAHYILDRITTPDDVREKLKLPPLGIVPRKKRNEELAELMADRRSAISEAYASLVTTLQFTTTNGIPPVLLVTSAVAAEGKSTTSLAVARLLAQHGKRVLLFDADLRKPSFVVEETSDLGFSKLVTAGDGVSRHVLKTSENNLWLLPSGPPPSNPVQLLNSMAARRVIDEVRELFDVVVIDAPPTYGIADAPLLAAMSDAVLLVVESGKTRRRIASDALARLRSAGAVVVGVALTKYRFDARDYGYSYYAGYGDDPKRIRTHELAVGLLSGRADD
jgi:succinoglycan biosynthesis transport protein ExoP